MNFHLNDHHLNEHHHSDLMPIGQLDEQDLAKLAESLVTSGVDISHLTDDQVDALLAGGMDADTIHAVLPHHNPAQMPEHRGGEPRFGAGTCGHCGGTGRAYWPSSGTETRCTWCNGSGVA